MAGKLTNELIPDKLYMYVALYLTIIRRRRNEYLVNKPLQAAGMSADNVRG